MAADELLLSDGSNLLLSDDESVLLLASETTARPIVSNRALTHHVGHASPSRLITYLSPNAP